MKLKLFFQKTYLNFELYFKINFYISLHFKNGFSMILFKLK